MVVKDLSYSFFVKNWISAKIFYMLGPVARVLEFSQESRTPPQGTRLAKKQI
jgi:hypothetical protein